MKLQNLHSRVVSSVTCFFLLSNIGLAQSVSTIRSHDSTAKPGVASEPAVNPSAELIKPPKGVVWVSGRFSEETSLWVVGHWSDRLVEVPTGEDLKKLIVQFGYMDNDLIAHLPDGSEVATIDGRPLMIAPDNLPSYCPPPERKVEQAKAMAKAEYQPKHKSNNWFTHRLKPSTDWLTDRLKPSPEGLRLLAVGILAGLASNRGDGTRIERRYISGHYHNGRYIRGHYRNVRVRN